MQNTKQSQISKEQELKLYIRNHLIKFLPIIFDFYDEYFNFLSNVSKNMLHKKFNEIIPNGKVLQWNKLYLTPPKIYNEFNAWFKEKKQTYFGDILDSIFLDNPEKISSFINAITNNVIDTPNSEIDNIFHEMTIGNNALLDLKYLLEVSIARNFEIASYIVHKKHLTTLISEVINQKKVENLSKIALIDPSALEIPEIIDFINQLPFNEKGRFYHKSAEAFSLPIIHNKKNKISQKALIFLCLFDNMTLINGSISFTTRELRDIADEIGILDSFEDIDYFDKILRNYKKSKSQGMNSK